MKLPLSRALVFIFLSVIVISGPAFLGLLYYQSLIKTRSEDNQYLLRTVLSSSSALPISYLCETLDLSCDSPNNLYQLNRKEMERKLKKSPLLKEVQIKKILPDKLWIHYSARTPVALLGDYQNIAIDEKGCPFPFHPFFTGMKLPTFYLNDAPCHWNHPIKNKNFQTALDLYHLISKHLNTSTLRLSHIDVTKISEKSLGKREIVIKLEKNSLSPLYLRLTPENYQDELSRFFVLKKKLPSDNKAMLIDLRLPQLAFLKVDI